MRNYLREAAVVEWHGCDVEVAAGYSLKPERCCGLGLAWPVFGVGLAWLGMAWHGLAWLGLAWLGLACPAVPLVVRAKGVTRNGNGHEYKTTNAA